MTQPLEGTSNQVQIFKTRFELAQKALNEIDDLFEYRYKEYSYGGLQEKVYEILENYSESISD